jgi:polysaccharide export outer membrane protein
MHFRADVPYCPGAGMRRRSAFVTPWLVLAVLLPLLSNCMVDGSQTAAAPITNTTAIAASETGDQAPAANASKVTALASAGRSATDYLISPRDILDVAVFQVPDLNKAVQVSEDGNITLPLVGKLRVAGNTTQDAEDALAAKLRQKYLQSPQVTIIVKQYGQKITVSGEVKNPRVMAVEGTVTLSQAVANGGGLTDLANTKRVHVARANGQKIDDIIYNFDAIQSGQAPDPVLQGGDLVVAEQSGALVALKNVKDMLPFAVLASVL